MGNRYGDVPKGLYIVRGENVVLMGEIDLDREDEIPHSAASQIPSSAIPQLRCISQIAVHALSVGPWNRTSNSFMLSPANETS